MRWTAFLSAVIAVAFAVSSDLRVWLHRFSRSLVGQGHSMQLVNGLDGPGILQHDASNTVAKPRIDKLVYKPFILDNGLQCLCISDPEAEKAAASLDVRVGSLADPLEIPGLAHFLEHMLFYSSEKYPEEDAYSRFISEHGGRTNAYTAAEDTNYHSVELTGLSVSNVVDVNADSLAPALDRFAQFFIGPQISQDGVEREANAVDSEHSKNLNSDVWKMMQLWKWTSNPEHPFHKFSTGNLDTLIHQPKQAGLSVHQEVRKFWEQHYSANLMRLVVYGKEPVTELQTLVQETFKPVVNRNLQPMDVPEDVVPDAYRGRLLRMVPEREGHTVVMEWVAPPEWKAYRQSPIGFIARFLGDEGEGSAFALLKARGWASSLAAGESGNSFSSVSFLMIKIELTEEGNRELQAVCSVLFQYIRLLSAPGALTQQRFDEYTALQQLRFDFRDKSPPFGYVSMLAHNMQLYRPEDLLLATYNVPQQYDATLIQETLLLLTPQAVRIMWASKSHQDITTEQEPVYGTSYSNTPVPEDWMASWNGDPVDPALHLPDPNPFVPTDLALVQDAAADLPPPSVVSQTDELTLWHRTDTFFETPKATVYIDMLSAEAYSTPENAVMTRLVIKLMGDYLNELTYPAELAGLFYHVSTATTGMTLWLNGYHHKLPVLLDHILDKLKSFSVKEDRFLLQKEQLTKEYTNIMYQQPYQQAFYAVNMVTELTRWHYEDYQQVIKDITAAQLQDFFPRLMHRVSLQAYVTGNLPQQAATALLQQCQQALYSVEGLGSRPLFSSQRPQRRVLQLPGGTPILRCEPGSNPANGNSAAVILFQVGPDEMQRNVLADLFVQIAQRDAFHQLRTVEQLGYIVTVMNLPVLAVRNIAFVLQANAYTAAHLESRVDAFLETFAAKLAALTDEEFAEHVKELQKAKADKPKSLRQQASRDWTEIQEGTRVFGRQDKEIKQLAGLSKQQLLDFAQEYVLGSGSRRKLSVHIRKQGEVEDVDQGPSGNALVVEDVWWFKRTLPAYPSRA